MDNAAIQFEKLPISPKRQKRLVAKREQSPGAVFSNDGTFKGDKVRSKRLSVSHILSPQRVEYRKASCFISPEGVNSLGSTPKPNLSSRKIKHRYNSPILSPQHPN